MRTPGLEYETLVYLGLDKYLFANLLKQRIDSLSKDNECIDKLQLKGQNLGRVFNSRSGHTATFL
jgi:hypothetical protein